MRDAITFDDVLLVPAYNHYESRKVVDIAMTDKTGRLSLKLPLMTANMDTITEAEMVKRAASAYCIASARLRKMCASLRPARTLLLFLSGVASRNKRGQQLCGMREQSCSVSMLPMPTVDMSASCSKESGKCWEKRPALWRAMSPPMPEPTIWLPAAPI